MILKITKIHAHISFSEAFTSIWFVYLLSPKEIVRLFAVNFN